MDFGRAVGVAFIAGSNRKLTDGGVDETEQVAWSQAMIGIAILLVVQVALLLWSGATEDAGLMRDLALAAFAALAVPFVLFWIGARMTGTTARLPAAFLYVGVTLAVVQLVSAVLSYFGVNQSGFLIGILFATMFLAARGFLRLGWAPAILIGVLVVAGFIGAGMLFMLLPTGRLLA